MDPTLAQSLENPSMVVAAGPRSAKSRPALKQARGLKHFGAAVMLGAALLSPVHSVAAQAPDLTAQQAGQVELTEQADGNTSGRKASYSSWSPRSDDYKDEISHIHKTLDKGGEVAQWRWDWSSNKLLTDAYHEISAGHSVENPSGRLLDICRQVQRVDQSMPGFDSHPHSDMTFKACSAEGMALEIKKDSAKKFAIATPVLAGLLAVKGLASAAQIGSGVYLAGTLGGSSVTRRRQNRDEAKGQQLSQTNTQPKPPGPTP